MKTATQALLAKPSEIREFTITSADAVTLTRSLLRAVAKDIFFAQSLMTARPEDLEALARIIKGANSLRSNKLDDFQKTIHRAIKLTERALRRSEKANVNPTRIAREGSAE
jgi:hypothetical protein